MSHDLLLCHTPDYQVSKYCQCWDAFARMLTNSTEITLSEKVIDDKILLLVFSRKIDG